MLDMPDPWGSTVVIVADGKLVSSNCFVTGNSDNC